MKFSDLELNQLVKDSLWGATQYGTVVKILKTRAKIKYGDEVVTYDKAHIERFLKHGEVGK
jgi:hypothetical protein